MGRAPAMAMPIAVPTMPDSFNGVSITRSSPNRSCKPSVIRKTPPEMPTSSPNRIVSGRASIASARAALIASAMVHLAVGPDRTGSLPDLPDLLRRELGQGFALGGLHFVKLFDDDLGDSREGMAGDVIARGQRPSLDLGDCCLNLVRHLESDLLAELFVPFPAGHRDIARKRSMGSFSLQALPRPPSDSGGRRRRWRGRHSGR